MDSWKRLRLLVCVTLMTMLALAAIAGAPYAPGRPTVIIDSYGFKWGKCEGGDWERLRCDPFSELRWWTEPTVEPYYWGIEIPQYLPEGTHGGFGVLDAD